MKRSIANLLLLTAGAVWGMGFVAQSSAMHRIGPWTLTAAKFLLAAACVAPFALAEKRRHPELGLRLLARFGLVGAFLFGGAILQQIGIMTTSVTNSGFLTGLYVVLTPILLLLLFRTHPHPVVWPAATAALAGTVLVGGGRVTALKGGDVLTILCAVFFALQILTIARFGRAGERPFALCFVQFAVTGLLSLAGALMLEPLSLAPLLAAAPEVLYLGILSSGLAFTLQVIGQRHTSAPQAAILLSSEAPFAALFGMLILGERIAPLGLLGCATIFAAMLAVELVPVFARRPAANAP